MPIMKTLGQIVQTIITLRKNRYAQLTLLAVYPSSHTVLEAAVMVASRNNAPMLLTTTMNQVDQDGGYTGWTQKTFIEAVEALASRYGHSTLLYPCLAYCGPWLKDTHVLNSLSLEETMLAVKASLTASLEAGYRLFHIDPVGADQALLRSAMQVETSAARAAELIAYIESERARLNLPPVDYEVSTTEIHGKQANLSNIENFIKYLHRQLAKSNLLHAWPCFVVANVGTDMYTTYFDDEMAVCLHDIVSMHGMLVKAHYTDWVTNPKAYPSAGMGGANIGQELTTEEYLALAELEAREQAMCRYRSNMRPSNFLKILEEAVIASERWRKWSQPGEEGAIFANLPANRRLWLAQTSARYVWTDPAVMAAREALYSNVQKTMPDPHQYVLDRVAAVVEKYISAFNLFDAMTLLG
jgi:D-tagatose-1,6-bisphosphate aldolase subunit GatZ/KbaZ